jgi:hypothetical protein
MNRAERVGAWADDETPKDSPRPGRFNLQEFINQHQLKVRKEKLLPEGGKLYELETCPFNSEHTNGSAFIVQSPAGELSFKCHHNSCDGKRWPELRALLEPSYRPWSNNGTGKNAPPAPPTICFKSKSVEHLMSLTVVRPSMLIESIIPTPGVVSLVGAKKSGKTILGVQIAIALAGGERHLWGQCKINQLGVPTLVLQQDDPAGEASLQLIVESSPISTKGKPFRWEVKKDLALGPDFLYTLESEIQEYGYQFVFLDSYTTLRPRRKSGGDIVKDELEDFRSLDVVGKRNKCTIVMSHHISHGNSGKAWSERAGGTFGVGMAVEALIFIDKLPELGINSPERLVRIEGRHLSSSARILRFREPTQDYEHVAEGAAAEHWATLVDLKKHFLGKPFTPKDLIEELGLSRSTSTRMIARLMFDGVIRKVSYGAYLLSEAVCVP